MQMKKSLKIILITTLAVVVLCAALFTVVPKIKRSEVDVYPVSRIREYAWGNSLGSYGTVTASNSQIVYPDPEMIIKSIDVSVGDSVEIGDILVSYDTAILDLLLKSKQIETEIMKNRIKKAEKELQSYKELVPSEPPPSPETPAKLIVAGAELTSDTAQSLSVKGMGTSKEDRLVFNCTFGVIIENEFLEGLYREEEVPAPTEADPSATETVVVTQYVEFRVFYYNNVYMYNWKIDGSDLKDFNFDELENGWNLSKSITVDEEMFIRFGKVDKRFAKLTMINSSVDYYGGPHYSEKEISMMINRKENELAQYRTDLKMLILELEDARAKLNEGSVKSEIEGVVFTVNDPDNMEAGAPLIVIFCEMGYRVEGAVSELNYEKIKKGQNVTVSSWNMSESIEAVVADISVFPTKFSYGSTGMENPQNSFYKFIAMIDTDVFLNVGDWVEITIEGASSKEPDQSIIYLPNAFIRHENGAAYVLIADEEGKLFKKFITTGRSNYGYSTEIRSGITLDDLIAFPYGKEAKEGSMSKVAEGMYW